MLKSNDFNKIANIEKSGNNLVRGEQNDDGFMNEHSRVDQFEILSPQEKVIRESINVGLKKRQFHIKEIKEWCDVNLTPVAWARILLHLFPIMRDYGYDFLEMQNPTSETRVRYDFYLVLKATIQEMYGRAY